jgi:hypothetical protein
MTDSRAVDKALYARLAPLVARAFPSGTLQKVRPLGNDVAAADGSHKGTGYGAPLYLEVKTGDKIARLVLHSATPNPFGHDRRADRAAEMLLAFDTFGMVPGQAAALDVGAYLTTGETLSLREAGEFYLLTEWAAGEPYAADLRAIERRGALTATDRARGERLMLTLAELHQAPRHDVTAWQRAVRDLFGSGEGIFGLIDGYPANTPAAPPERLERLERLALQYRRSLREQPQRLRKIHGDFHPFNIVFGEGDQPVLLDASRGCLGDPADDLCCIAINYLFFGLLSRSAAKIGFRELWRLSFRTYFARRPDPELLSVAPPYFAWRALVLANPRWYPDFDEDKRHRLLELVEHTLAAGQLDPDQCARLLEGGS